MTLIRLAIVLMALSVSSAFATVSTYTHVVSTSTTSLTINNSTHGMGSKAFGVNVYNGAGTILTRNTHYTYSINPTTYAVSFTFSPAFTGTIKVVGPLPNLTTASTDFELTKSGDNTTLFVCAMCTYNGYARRYANAVSYGMYNASSFSMSSGTATVRVFMRENRIVYGISVGSGSASGSCTGGNCSVEYSVTSFPAGVLQIGHVTATSTLFGTITDDRPF